MGIKVGRKGLVRSFVGARSCCVSLLTFGSWALSLSVNAGMISPPAVVGNYSCEATASFASYDDCVGMVTYPSNEAAGNPTKLVTYLNGLGIQQNYVGWIGLGMDDPWGVQGDWRDISEPLNAPGTSSDNLFAVSGDKTSGGWSFDAGNLLIDYLLVSVRSSGGWSAYYYDLTDADVTSFASTWDTFGLGTNGANGSTGPDMLHLFAAYIPGDEVSLRNEERAAVPLPGTSLLFALGIAILGVARRLW
jgi:hypothetical protein